MPALLSNSALSMSLATKLEPGFVMVFSGLGVMESPF